MRTEVYGSSQRFEWKCGTTARDMNISVGQRLPWLLCRPQWVAWRRTSKPETEHTGRNKQVGVEKLRSQLSVMSVRIESLTECNLGIIFLKTVALMESCIFHFIYYAKFTMMIFKVIKSI
jgi:hypothetical protein